MKQSFRKLFISLLVFLCLSIILYSQTVPVSVPPGVLLVQAEDLTTETGGAVVKVAGRPGSIGECLTTWNNTGHILEWKAQVPAAGSYSLVLHIAAGRKYKIYREIKIDGAIPAPEFAKITFEPTGGFGKAAENWKKVRITKVDGAPSKINLSAGEHLITATNLGGDGSDGAMNIDYIALVPAGVSDATLPGGGTTVTAIKPAAIPAFPGAQGAGKYTQGGRGGKVFVVTSLADSGPGTLREAVMATGPRIITFALSGIIELKSRLNIGSPYLTIAGESAPGEGITLTGNSLTIGTQHVILRYLRVRMGTKVGGEADALTVDTASYVILDHLSTSWSVDETLSVSDSDNVTVQWCVISESMANSLHSKGSHGYGSLIRMSRGQKVTYHHNFYAHHNSRLPRPGNYNAASVDPVGGFFDFRNNVIYNWGSDLSGYNADKESITSYNFIGNWYQAGPSSKPEVPMFQESSKMARMYIEGNAHNGAIPADQKTLITGDGLRDGYFQDKAFPIGELTSEDAASAMKQVIARAGASRVRDTVDLRLAKEFESQTGKIIDGEDDVGGYPVMKSEKGPLDSDLDGMPDSYEITAGLDPMNPADATTDPDKNGYTAIEDYLHSLVKYPKRAFNKRPFWIFQAEIGTIRFTEKIDALESMSVDPVRYLVFTRVLAIILTFQALQRFRAQLSLCF